MCLFWSDFTAFFVQSWLCVKSLTSQRRYTSTSFFFHVLSLCSRLWESEAVSLKCCWLVKYMGFTDCEPLWIESSQACLANTHHSNKHHANCVSEKQENQSDLGTWRQMNAITKALKMCVLCHSGASWVNMCHNSCSVTAVAFKRSCV